MKGGNVQDEKIAFCDSPPPPKKKIKINSCKAEDSPEKE